MERHGLTARGQRVRTGIAHSTLTNWKHGVRPGVEAVVQFARGLGEDVGEALRAAGYTDLSNERLVQDSDAAEKAAQDTAARAADILRLDFERLFRDRTERPQDYYHRRFGELAMVCAEHGLQLVPPRFSGGSESLETVEQAESVVAHLAEMLAEAHPEHADELRAVARGGERE